MQSHTTMELRWSSSCSISNNLDRPHVIMPYISSHEEGKREKECSKPQIDGLSSDKNLLYFSEDEQT